MRSLGTNYNFLLAVKVIFNIPVQREKKISRNWTFLNHFWKGIGIDIFDERYKVGRDNEIIWGKTYAMVTNMSCCGRYALWKMYWAHTVGILLQHWTFVACHLKNEKIHSDWDTIKQITGGEDRNSREPNSISLCYLFNFAGR